MSDVMAVANQTLAASKELTLNKLHDVISFKLLQNGMLITHNEVLTWLSNEDVAALRDWIKDEKK